MHCLEFRRTLLAEPGRRDAVIRAHLRHCVACSRWAEESVRFESLLRQAIDVDVPENLASRILLHHEFRYPHRDPPRRGAFALAASILVAVLLGGALMWFELKPTLADDVFVHMDDTSYALTSTAILDDDTVDRVFSWFGAEVSPELGDMSFANVCVFRGKRVAHIVLQDTLSLVTVMIMPEERLVRPSHIRREGRSGLLLPFAGGSMAIVSVGGQRLDELEDRIRNMVRWPAATSDPDAVPS